MVSILDFKKQSQTRFTNLKKKFEPRSFNVEDPRFWKFTYDKDSKVGSAVIRFVGPAKDASGNAETKEFVRRLSHGFKKNNKWYIEECPRSIGKDCPVCKYAFEMKDTENEDKSMWTREYYILNILVISDPANPENNGKVFLWKCPRQIMTKIKNAITPEYDEDESINVFDMWQGANFRLRSTNKGGFVNYENSSFEAASPIFDDTENMTLFENLWNKLYSLSEFENEDQYKSYEELKNRFDNVMNNTTTSSSYKDNLENHELESTKDDLTNNTEVNKVTTEEISEDSFFDEFE